MTWGKGKGCCVQLSSDCVALAFRIQVLFTPLDKLPFQRDPVFSYNLSELWFLYSGSFSYLVRLSYPSTRPMHDTQHGQFR